MWSSGEDLAFSPPWPGFDSRHGNLFNLIDTVIARSAYEDNPLLSSLKGPCGAIGSASDSRSEG